MIELVSDGAQVKRRGLGFRQQTWANSNITVTLTLERVRETRDGIGGMLGVDLTHPKRPGAPSFRLDQFTYSLASLSSRTTAVRHLTEATTAENLDKLVWDRLLQKFSADVLRMHGEGEPVVKVGRLPQTNNGGALLWPLVWQRKPTTLFAPGGTGKSTLAAGIAVQAQTGATILPGTRTVLTAPVLVLDWETDQDAWNATVAAVARGAGIEAPDVLYRRMNRPLVDDVERVAAIVDENGVGAIIVDSVEAASGSSRDGEGYAEKANGLHDALRLLGCASLLIDHVKGDDLDRDGATPKPYGSVFKVNRAQGGVFELKAQRDPTPERIEVAIIDVKRNRRAKVQPIGLAMHFGDMDADGIAQSISFTATDIEAPELQAASRTLRDRMRIAVRQGARTVKDAAEELGTSESNIRKYVSRYPEFQSMPPGMFGLKAKV